MYDPLFSQLEIAVLNTLGVIVLRENEVSGLGKERGEGCAAAGPSLWPVGASSL